MNGQQLVDEARSWDYLREGGGQNRGLRVEAVQHYSGGQFGDSWCMELVWLCVDRIWKGKPPFDRQQSVQAFRELATFKGWLTPLPVPGDLCLSIDPAADHAHHIGIVTGTAPLTTIAGNTDATGASSNGDGVHEHPVDPAHKLFVRLPYAQ